MWPLPAGPPFSAFLLLQLDLFHLVIHDSCKMPLEINFICLDKEIAAFLRHAA